MSTRTAPMCPKKQTKRKLLTKVVPRKVARDGRIKIKKTDCQHTNRISSVTGKFATKTDKIFKLVNVLPSFMTVWCTNVKF